MKWKTFKEEIPEYDKPIFVYKTNGIFRYFKVNDDIMSCVLVQKTESQEGITYHLQGYDYESTKYVEFTEKVFMKMKWIDIPKPE